MAEELFGRIVLFVALTGSGVALVWSARAAASGRLTRNPIVGIRVPATMASDDAWLVAHRRAERPTIAAGILAAASGACALLPVPMPVIVVAVLVATVGMLVLVLYGARVGIRAVDAANGAPDATGRPDAAG